MDFYEVYKDDGIVSPLVTQLSWSNHLKIMSACKTMEERIFYMNMCIKEKYSARELARISHLLVKNIEFKWVSMIIILN